MSRAMYEIAMTYVIGHLRDADWCISVGHYLGASDHCVMAARHALDIAKTKWR